MTPLALVLVASALVAPLHAASIPDAADLHKKIPAPLPDDIKDPSPNQDLIAPEPAKDIGNELRIKPEDIPVQVVVENQPSVKVNEIDEEEIKRPEVDLRNPGPPQRQEHETQNPEQHSDEQLKITTIKESIERAQNLLKESFQDVSDNIQSWIQNNDGQNNIQKNIQDLRDTFTSQIKTLKDTVQGLIKPEASEAVEVTGEETQINYDKIQSRFKILEDNFNNDVETFSAGVDLVASLRSSVDTAREEPAAPETPIVAASPSPPAQTAAPTPAPPQNIFIQAMNNIRDRMNESMNALQNLLTGQGSQPSNPPAEAQADTPAGTPSPPFSLPSIQDLFSNRPNISSFFQNPLGNRPLASFFPSQTNITTFFQNLIPSANRPNGTNIFQSLNPAGFFNPTTAKPVEAANANPADKPAESSPEAAVDKPTDETASAPAQSPAPAPQPASAEPQPGGPIRQFLNSIPVVQRIQNSITNRDTPRDTTEKSNSQMKAGWYGPAKPPGSGDNNDVNSGVSEKKSEEVKEHMKEEPIKEESKKEEAEIKPEPIPEKTE